MMDVRKSLDKTLENELKYKNIPLNADFELLVLEEGNTYLGASSPYFSDFMEEVTPKSKADMAWHISNDMTWHISMCATSFAIKKEDIGD